MGIVALLIGILFIWIINLHSIISMHKKQITSNLEKIEILESDVNKLKRRLRLRSKVK